MSFDRLDANTASELARLRRTLRRNTQQDAIQAILGDETGRISVDGQPEYYYVRIANGSNTDGTTQYGRAFPVLSGAGYMGGEKVGQAVYIGMAYDGQLAILGTDRAALAEDGKNPRAENPNGVYRNFFYMRNADLFMAKPLGTQQTQVMEVRVEASPYIDADGNHVMFPGGKIDLAGDVPAADGDGNNQHLISGVFINRDGDLESVTSTAKLVEDTITWGADVVECFNNRSARAFPVRYYKLFTGHVLLTEGDDWGDGRDWVSAPKRKNNYTAIIAPTVDDDIDLGYEVGSAWIDTVLNRVSRCVDETDGAAVWKSTSSGADDYINITNTDSPYPAADKPIIYADTSGGDITITLPPVASNGGSWYTIKNTGTGIVTIDPNSSETIDKDTTLIINTQYDAPKIHCDGADWWII